MNGQRRIDAVAFGLRVLILFEFLPNPLTRFVDENKNDEKAHWRREQKVPILS